MNILITGANGFIGSRVLDRLLEKRYDVTVLSSSQKKNENVTNLPSNGYHFDENYLNLSCPNVEVILHIGAFTPKTSLEADNIKCATTNIVNTETLISAANRLEKLRKFIYISTLDVYTDTNDVLSEATITVPKTMYGWSKLYCEKMVTKWAEQKGIDYEILRLGHVFGEGEEKYHKAMPVMINNAIHGKDITIFGDGEAIRTYIYIDDVVTAIVNSMYLDESQIINVVGNEHLSINQLAELIVKNSGNNVAIIHRPSSIPNRNLLFDNTRLLSTLIDTLTPFCVGLNREIEYCKGIQNEIM